MPFRRGIVARVPSESICEDPTLVHRNAVRSEHCGASLARLRSPGQVTCDVRLMRMFRHDMSGEPGRTR